MTGKMIRLKAPAPTSSVSARRLVRCCSLVTAIMSLNRLKHVKQLPSFSKKTYNQRLNNNSGKLGYCTDPGDTSRAVAAGNDHQRVFRYSFDFGTDPPGIVRTGNGPDLWSYWTELNCDRNSLQRTGEYDQESGFMRRKLPIGGVSEPPVISFSDTSLLCLPAGRGIWPASRAARRP